MMVRAVLVGAFMMAPMMYFQYVKHSMQSALESSEMYGEASGAVDVSHISADMLKQGIVRCVELRHGDLIPKRQRRMIAYYITELKYHGNRKRALSGWRGFLRATNEHRRWLQQRDKTRAERYSNAVFMIGRQRDSYYSCGVHQARKAMKNRGT